MEPSVHRYRVFVASPSDVAQERSIARKVIAELSRNLGDDGGFTLEAWGWEDVRPGLAPEPGRAQALINPLVDEADLLIGILWKRFGASTGVAESGTREEFDRIHQRWRQKQPVEAMMYFRDPPPDMLADTGPQLAAVLAFRKECEQLGLYCTYSSPEEFGDKLRSHLTKWLTERQRGGPTKTATRRGARQTPRVFEQAALTERFLKAQAAEHAYLPMTGFETRVRIPVELEQVLVPLRARLVAAETARPRAVERRLDPDTEDGVIDFDQAWRRARSRKIPTLVVLGQPGSGKTTLLKHLLLRCTASSEKLDLSPGTVPLLLPLRQVHPREGLVKSIRRVLRTDRQRLPEDLFDEPLGDGRALLLLDGLDEVASATARERTARWIEEQRRCFPDCATVVTSRFAGYVGAARLEIPNLELALERFRAPEIRAFLERWFITVETMLGKDTEFFQQRGREVAGDLFERIVAVPELFALAANPLMLQIIALVHRDRGALPERRVELYDECTNVLLEHWDRAKKGLDVPLTAKEARRVLQPVAYWMHQVPERRYAPARELLPLIRAGLAEFPKKKVKAEEFLALIRDRSGLFTGYGTDEYGFQHLSFQEFLAAGEVRRRERYAELVRVYGEAWWREATRLLMGLEDPSCFEPFMRLLVASERFLQHAELTAACIRDAFEPSARPFVAALESTLARRAKERDVAMRQYHLLLALRELAPEKIQTVASILERAAADASSAEARALASELLAKLGVERRVEVDAATGLPTLRVNPVDGSELVLIPAGAFMAGDPDQSDNRPQRMELPAFYLARYPVTNAQYAQFLTAKPETAKPRFWDDEQFNQPQQPVVGVRWQEAEAYCGWAGLRLPTEWEWEKGARGTDGRPYPWGNDEPDETRANFESRVGQPTPVGSYAAGASPYGLMDMAGNVWEWTASLYKEEEDWRTVRGGCFNFDAQNLRAACRLNFHPGNRNFNLGFRCAQDP
jgi:formylglycine-generating enzyme required for sulfatase activity